MMNFEVEADIVYPFTSFGGKKIKSIINKNGVEAIDTRDDGIEIAFSMGLELGKIKIKCFADGELYVQVQESVRGCDVFFVQSTGRPTNENIMELLIMIDACRRALEKTVTAVIPYFGYARADRQDSNISSTCRSIIFPTTTHKMCKCSAFTVTLKLESVVAKLVANLITKAGADPVLACDLHSGRRWDTSILVLIIKLDRGEEKHSLGLVEMELHFTTPFHLDRTTERPGQL